MVKITLEYPVEFDGKTITEIELSRPKGKHLKTIKQDAGLAEMMLVASKLTGLPNKVFEEMDGADLIKVTGQIGDFLGTGQAIGLT